MGEHAVLSASGSHRWLNCPPSARLEEQFPIKSSVYTEEGTLAHSVAEACVRKELGENVSLKDFSTNELYTAEMLECGKAYASFVVSQLKERQNVCPDAFIELETRLDFSEWVPEGFGTGDCIIVSDDMLEVIDYKYGKGVPVSAHENSQMRLYALGALSLYNTIYDFKTVRMTIFQPRLSLEPDMDELTTKKLLTWAKKVVKPTAKLAIDGKGEFNPSESTCRFCRAKEQCAARAKKLFDLFDENKDAKELLTVDECAELLVQAKDMRAWLTDLENLVTSSLFSGEKVKGWKLVEGRSVRKISNEDEAVKALMAAGIDQVLLYEKKLISLTQMEKDFGKKKTDEILGDLIVKPQGKPTLAPESDKRPEITPEAAILQAFDE